MRHARLAIVALLLAPRGAAAQASPLIETVKPQAAASSGKTDLTPSTLATPARNEEEEQYATALTFSLGGLFASGNARTVAVTTAAQLRLRRYEHQFAFAAAANFARAARTGEAAETTVENYQGLARYEYFLTPRLSAFFQTIHRRDRFQGLDLRSNFDPGLAYHFIQTKNQRLVLEQGYDLQHDIRRDDALVTTVPSSTPGGAPTVSVSTKTRTLHNLRTYLGYESSLYAEVSFVSSLEYLQNFEDTDLYRMVFDVGLKTTLREKLAISATYTVRYENQPLPDRVKADSLASVALVYTLF